MYVLTDCSDAFVETRYQMFPRREMVLYPLPAGEIPRVSLE